MIASLGLDRERVSLVAGNHDIQWKPDGMMKTNPRTNASRENYLMFMELFKKRRPGLAEMTEIPSRCGNRILRLLALDSNAVESENAAGIGYISSDTLKDGKSLLAENIKEKNGKEKLTWIVTHHHIFPNTSLRANDIENKKISVMGNVPEILHLASTVNAELILHGHEHQPSITKARRWPIDNKSDFQKITTICAGSISGRREDLGPFSRNHYYIIYRRANDILVRSRVMGPNGIGFTAHDDIQLFSST